MRASSGYASNLGLTKPSHSCGRKSGLDFVASSLENAAAHDRRTEKSRLDMDGAARLEAAAAFSKARALKGWSEGKILTPLDAARFFRAGAFQFGLETGGRSTARRIKMLKEARALIVGVLDFKRISQHDFFALCSLLNQIDEIKAGWAYD